MQQFYEAGAIHYILHMGKLKSCEVKKQIEDVTLHLISFFFKPLSKYLTNVCFQKYFKFQMQTIDLRLNHYCIIFMSD